LRIGRPEKRRSDARGVDGLDSSHDPEQYGESTYDIMLAGFGLPLDPIANSAGILQSAFSSRRAVLLSRCARMSPDLAQIAAQSARISGGAGLVVSFDFHDALTARIANEFLYAPTSSGFDTVLEITGPGMT
jgi:hypothetical protein